MRRGEKMRGQSTFKHAAARYESVAVALEAAARHSRALPRTRWPPTATCSKPTMPPNPQQGTTRRAHRSCEQVLRGGVAEAS